MTKELKLKPVSIAIGAAVAGSLGFVSMASAIENPFTADTMDAGYMLAGGDHGEKSKEGKCGEGKCGEDKAKMKAKKAGAEGKCGEAHKAAHEGKCGGDKAKAKMKGKMEGKCGEGKCGGDKAKAKKADMEGSCGEAHKAAHEGKCGGAKKDDS